MAGTEDAWKALQQANDWIKVADAKAAAALAGSGVLGGLLVRGFPRLGEWQHAPWRASFILAGFVMVSASALLALSVVLPRLRNTGQNSTIFFGHIALRYRDVHNFKASFLPALDREAQLRELLAEQLWSNSRVAQRKLRTVSVSVWLLGAALAMAAIAGIMH
ncbi:Pycsar system effector family protein [Saccharopolyspora sp. NPDC002376]